MSTQVNLKSLHSLTTHPSSQLSPHQHWRQYIMSSTGPPADAKQAQAAALAELEAAQRKKRAIDTTLVRIIVSLAAEALGAQAR